MNDSIKVFGKDFEDMTYEELKLERRAHSWARYRLNSCAKHQTMRLYALEQRPLYTKEEYTKMYEDGEITYGKYRTMAAEMAKLKREIATARATIQYGFALVDHEQAIVTYLDELIDQANTKRKISKPRKSGKPVYDPRRNISWSNHNNKNRTENLRPPKKVVKYAQKWSEITAKEKSAAAQLRSLQPNPAWDKEKFKKVAESRGVHTDAVLYAMIAEELMTSVGHARAIVSNGKMTWGEIILIAALFEMTPAEFCDCFLSEVFDEVVDGKWVATVDDDNKDALRARVSIGKTVQNTDGENEER